MVKLDALDGSMVIPPLPEKPLVVGGELLRKMMLLADKIVGPV